MLFGLALKIPLPNQQYRKFQGFNPINPVDLDKRLWFSILNRLLLQFSCWPLSPSLDLEFSSFSEPLELCIKA